MDQQPSYQRESIRFLVFSASLMHNLFFIININLMQTKIMKTSIGIKPEDLRTGRYVPACE